MSPHAPDERPTRSDTLRAIARAVRQHVDSAQRWGVTQMPTKKRTTGSAGRGRSSPASSSASATAHASRSGASAGPKHAAARSAGAAEPAAKPLPRTRAERIAALKELEQEAVNCKRCPLLSSRTQAVFGDGDPEAQLVFVGEAPGREEDRQGKPFVGAAGQLLNKMIEAMGYTRESVYICNVLKSRPPENRTPTPEEIEVCRPYLVEQLAIIRPRVICALGSVAARALLGPDIPITKARGQLHDYQGTPVIPTFHPAYLLRNPDAKKVVWQDLKKVKALLEKDATGAKS